MTGVSASALRFAQFASILLLVSAPYFADSEEFLVGSQEEYVETVKHLTPGDTISLANGEWRDFEIVFTGSGTVDKPITLTAETKGSVFITGRSNLRLAGSHLVVSGLVFRDGFTPTNEVISFRRTKQHYAYDSRVTEIVIDRFNNPERHETDFWVMMYGKRNRFDHSLLIGKQNVGVTMAVRLDSEESQENYHRIDHNYFGPRPVLGSNGGETLRIGTSKYSLINSNTLVERNYFERCNGEIEIISNKSGGNAYVGNFFDSSQGTLTLRHGNGNVVESNVFNGRGHPNTGGIRVINAEQVIRNNYLTNLTGRRFSAALVVMNGVPNSPINRYHQVAHSEIENNTIIDSDYVELAAGSDEERSAVPTDTYFRGNLWINDSNRYRKLPRAGFVIHDDISGIQFENNVYQGQIADVPNPNRSPSNEDGRSTSESSPNLTLKRASNGLLYPVGENYADIGVNRDFNVVARAETGPNWYDKPQFQSEFFFGQKHIVEPGQDTLTVAVAASKPGDLLLLKSGDYMVTKVLSIVHPLSIVAIASNDDVPNVLFERSTLFELHDGGSLRLESLGIDGRLAPDAYGNSVIRTSRYSMLRNYTVQIDNSQISNLNTNHSFNFLRVSKHTFAKAISIVNSSFSEITGDVVALDREIDDLGIYNGESISIEESQFENIDGAIMKVYRGGSDESTFGPVITIRENSIQQVGKGKRNKSHASVYLHGAQRVFIDQNNFSDSNPIRIEETVGEPVTILNDNRFVDTESPQILSTAS